MTLAALALHTLALFALGALIMAIGSRRVSRDIRGARFLKLLAYFVIVHGVLALAALGRPAVVALAGAVVVVSAWEGARAWRRMSPPRPVELPVLALTAGAGFVVASLRLEPASVAWIFLSSAAFDGFGQVVGQWLGRRPLAPSLSPAKTVEGLVGGLAAASLVALWLRDLAGLGPAAAALAGAAIGVGSAVGDLAGSWAKRRAGLKDFSAILPGQGGVIDRFSSFVVAMGMVGAWL